MSQSNQSIGLVIEGAYPYVAGGVSSWIHQLITKLPEFNFYLFILLAKKSDQKDKKYTLPQNVKALYHIYLQEFPTKPLFLPVKIGGRKFIDNWMSDFSLEKLIELMKYYSCQSNLKNLVIEGLYSKDAFEILEKVYIKKGINISFLNYFWIMRSLLINLLNLFIFTIPDPPKVIHAVSTGFGGLLASKIKISAPSSSLILTEHGIYTRERDLEISVGKWADTDLNRYLPEEGIGPFKEIWQESFSYISKVCYALSDVIITLNEKNRNIQIEQGAAIEKTSIIRNGINLQKYSYIKREQMSQPPIIGFLGRIVKIKDVKTLIRAANIVRQKVKNVVFKIAGPYDEDEEYFRECNELVSMLMIGDYVKFLGSVDAVKFFNEIDLLVLSSISEGQPLVIAEAASCGVPTVATDVGGCREMLYGNGTDDNLGMSGIIVEQANVDKLADAILRFIAEPHFYAICSEVGRRRAEQFYDEKILIQSYRDIYNRLLKKG